jgi:S1-C subfamily serine protease
MDHSRRRFLGALSAVGAAGVAGCAQLDETIEGDDDSVGTSLPPPDQAETPYARAYREAIGSVALVRTFSSRGTGGQGSGFVYDEDHLVTNQHVVEGATEIDLRFAQGDWRSASVVGTDVYSDLAVLRVENRPEYATPLSLVDVDPQVGTEVMALGNPFGFGESVSAGIVSGVDRSLPGANDFVIPDAIQTDAAVNPGNSGGPLVTLEGEVVGVINSGAGNDLGFAISAALMRRVVPALLADGEYDHPYIGIRLNGVTPSIAEANDLAEVRGVHVVEVVDGGPADGRLQGSTGSERINGRTVRTGGDVIVRIDDRPIPSQSALSTYLSLETSPGDDISVEVLRDGDRETVAVTLGTRPEP